MALKFSDGDGPNLCRVKKVDVLTFIENIFRSGLTLVSSLDCLTFKQLRDLSQKKILKRLSLI